MVLRSGSCGGGGFQIAYVTKAAFDYIVGRRSHENWRLGVAAKTLIRLQACQWTSVRQPFGVSEASSLHGGNGRCSRRAASLDNPDAPAQPPKRRRLVPPR